MRPQYNPLEYIKWAWEQFSNLERVYFVAWIGLMAWCITSYIGV